MSEGQPFRRRTLYALIAVGVVSVLAALVLSIFAEDFQEEATSDASGFSRSTIGYEALIRILREVDIPVTTSKTRSAERASEGLLVIVAPDLEDDAARERLRGLVGSARRVLLVLPRWWTMPMPNRPEWIAGRVQRSAEDIEEALDALDIDAGVDWTDEPLLAPAEWGLPEVERAQVLVDHALTSEVDAGDGSFIASTWYDDDTLLWILADPTPLENAALRSRANLHFAIDLIDDLRRDGPVVFDETTHGFAEPPTIARALTRFPLVLVALQVVLCTFLLFWAAIGRWGPARAAPPPIGAGKDFLIRNTAALLHVGGHDGDALRRYLATSIHHVAQALHAPRDLDPSALRTWLERVRASRRGTVVLPELEGEVAAAAAARRSRAHRRRIVELATRIHRWRTEMTHGPTHHS